MHWNKLLDYVELVFVFLDKNDKFEKAFKEW